MNSDARKAIEKAIKTRAPGYDAAAVADSVLAEIAAAGLVIVDRAEITRQASQQFRR